MALQLAALVLDGLVVRNTFLSTAAEHWDVEPATLRRCQSDGDLRCGGEVDRCGGEVDNSTTTQQPILEACRSSGESSPTSVDGDTPPSPAPTSSSPAPQPSAATTWRPPLCSGGCRPCKFFPRSSGCWAGDACAYCHLPHKQPRNRPSKAVRRACKELLERGHARGMPRDLLSKGGAYFETLLRYSVESESP
mmetsp:Transcript_72754/g.204281  ORF Transcript_72754/g.204281 Transcript_72754/m.204281 type:complete len:193 (+) Transcript_72754:49-627(+)